MKMMRGLVGLGLSLAVVSTVAARPNIIFLMVDDWGWTDAGCYGSTYYETPNIDRLASEGMRFTQGYAACTVCSPTRASLMTGTYPTKHGVTDFIHSKTMKMEHEEVTIAEALKAAGYRTAHVGKWHLAPRGVPDTEAYYPTGHGFDVNIGGGHWGAPSSYFHPWEGRKTVENLPKDRKKGDFLTDVLTDETIRLMGEWKDDPFFIHLAYYAVHTPVMGKPEDVAHFSKKGASKGHGKAAYAALLRAVDDSVGRITKALDELGLADNTLIIPTGDNGGLKSQTSNAPLRAGKGSVYEGGVREPTIVRWPGVTPKGSTCDTPVITVDYYPTMIAAAGAKGNAAHNARLDGVDLGPILRDPAAPLGRDNLYWYFPHRHGGGAKPYAAIRHKDWRLITWLGTDKVELYDLATDIGESRDLSATQPKVAKKLKSLVDSWLQDAGVQIHSSK